LLFLPNLKKARSLKTTAEPIAIMWNTVEGHPTSAKELLVSPAFVFFARLLVCLVFPRVSFGNFQKLAIFCSIFIFLGGLIIISFFFDFFSSILQFLSIGYNFYCEQISPFANLVEAHSVSSLCSSPFFFFSTLSSSSSSFHPIPSPSPSMDD
jgi:hypothetical protein